MSNEKEIISLDRTAVKASIMTTDRIARNFRAAQVPHDLTTGLRRGVIKIAIWILMTFQDRYTVSRTSVFFLFFYYTYGDRHERNTQFPVPFGLLNYVTAFSHYARATPPRLGFGSLMLFLSRGASEPPWPALWLALSRTQQVFSRVLTFLNERFTRTWRESDLILSRASIDEQFLPRIIYSYAFWLAERNSLIFLLRPCTRGSAVGREEERGGTEVTRLLTVRTFYSYAVIHIDVIATFFFYLIHYGEWEDRMQARMHRFLNTVITKKDMSFVSLPWMKSCLIGSLTIITVTAR